MDDSLLFIAVVVKSEGSKRNEESCIITLETEYA
jgi:hypothetical protein